MDWQGQAYKIKNMQTFARDYSKMQLQQILKICAQRSQLRYVSNHVQDRIQFHEARQRALYSQQLLIGVIKKQSKSDNSIKHIDSQLSADVPKWLKIVRWISFILVTILSLIAGIVFFVNPQSSLMIWGGAIVGTVIVWVILELINKFSEKKYQRLEQIEILEIAT